jgi:hypothetical protein
MESKVTSQEGNGSAKRSVAWGREPEESLSRKERHETTQNKTVRRSDEKVTKRAGKKSKRNTVWRRRGKSCPVTGRERL